MKLLSILLLIMSIVSTGCASTGHISNLNNFSKSEFIRVFGSPQWVEHEFYDCSQDSNYVACRGMMGQHGLSYDNYMWKMHKLDTGSNMYLRLTIEEISEKQGELFHFETADTIRVYINLLDKPRGMQISDAD